ncbi:MAG: NAD(P)H-dependent oxidoreductase [Phycisphaerae bacterium]|nr:NAD(P)H-dependent oxidoreductase [Phycisphaerae bacterium]MDD5381540.1 NAD(P)H-dependent oxidoreductase [Phycisphaerae bacterium]
MTKISVILAHPNKESFNHAIAAAVVETLNENGHKVYFHDLYKENFDPVLPFEEFPKDTPLPAKIEKHCKEISQADGIIIIHPNWWGQPPAILKGWVDRVIRPGVAYEFREGDKGEGVPVGLLKAKSAIVFNTSNTETGREKKVFGDPLQTLWKNCIFNLCGIPDFYRRTFGVIVTSSAQQRKNWLREIRQTIDKYYQKNK